MTKMHRRTFLAAAAVSVDQKRVRHVGDAVALRDRIIAECDAIWHRGCLNERPYYFPAVFVHGNSDDSETFPGIFALEFREPGNLLLAAMTLGCPKIQQHDLALEFFRVTGFPELSSSASSGADL